MSLGPDELKRPLVGDARLLLPKPMRRELPDYLKWIRRQPCIIPKCYRKSQASHIVFDGQGRIGSKVQDSQALPMCHHHHRQYHERGRESFQGIYDLNPYQLIVDHLTDYLLRGEA